MEEKTKFCIHCGKKIPSSAEFCQFCGSNQGTMETTSENDNLPTNSQTTSNKFPSSISVDTPYNENDESGILNSTKLYFKDIFKINKRMGRADFWWATLGITLITTVIFFIFSFIQSAFLGGSNGFIETDIAGDITPTGAVSLTIFILMMIIYVVLAIASLTAEIRRLHDLGYNGAFWLINLIPAIGSIVMLIILCQPSKQRGNRYILQN